MLRLLVVMAALSACGKADYRKCQTAAKNFATLQYWDSVEAEIAATPAAERDAVRRAKSVELEQKLSDGIDMAISQCQAANNDEQIECLTKATTWAKARKCADDW